MSGKATPLYVVCSPGRSGGRTLVSRLLTEFYVLGDRPVAAFDLCDEESQLADYLPQLTTIADINDIRDQIRFFERLITEDEGVKIIDVSHRVFKSFFTTVQKIGFFEEARRHSLAPLILLVADAHPKSPEICATLRHWLPDAFLLPVRNVTERIAIPGPDTPPNELTTPTSLDVPLLRSSLRTLIDGQNFSFLEFWRARPTNLSDASDEELLDWLTSIFFQFQDIEVCLGCKESWTQIAAPASRPVRIDHHAQQRNAQPLGGRKFATKKVQRDALVGQSDPPLVTMLRKTTHQLQTAEDRITVFEASIKQWQDRAVQAETRLLKFIQNQINRSGS